MELRNKSVEREGTCFNAFANSVAPLCMELLNKQVQRGGDVFNACAIFIVLSLWNFTQISIERRGCVSMLRDFYCPFVAYAIIRQIK